MARLRRPLGVPSSYIASNRSTSWGVRRVGRVACVHCGGGGAAASHPALISPRKTRNRRNERTTTAGLFRPAPWRRAASWQTNAVSIGAVKEGQSGAAVPKQEVMKRRASGGAPCRVPTAKPTTRSRDASYSARH
jgi:hypothetical protein